MVPRVMSVCSDNVSARPLLKYGEWEEHIPRKIMFLTVSNNYVGGGIPVVILRLLCV